MKDLRLKPTESCYGQTRSASFFFPIVVQAVLQVTHADLHLKKTLLFSCFPFFLAYLSPYSLVNALGPPLWTLNILHSQHFSLIIYIYIKRLCIAVFSGTRHFYCSASSTSWACTNSAWLRESGSDSISDTRKPASSSNWSSSCFALNRDSASRKTTRRCFS